MNSTDHGGKTALLWAAQKGRDECVNVLIESGADVNVRDLTGMTALQAARAGGHDDCTESLTRAGAEE